MLGHRVDDLTASRLRASVGVVSQESYLFSGTIRENIAYGPDRTTFPLVSTGDRTRKAVDSSGRFRTEATETARAAILALFPDRRTALKSAEIAERIGLGKTRTNELLRGLVGDGLIVAEGSARNRVYRRAEQ